ncbi:MAG: PhoU domain-containing protein [Planctomycetota bacterium]
MTLTTDDYNRRLLRLRGEMTEQARRVRTLVELAFDGFFTGDKARAERAIELDDEIDNEDVEIERRAVALLAEAAREALPMPDEAPLRAILTLVKVNNEFERIADAGVEIAERTLALSGDPVVFPPVARVMTNSVVGIMRDIGRAYDRQDNALARLVLQAEDTVLKFKDEIGRHSEAAIAEGTLGVELAFDLMELTSQCAMMGAHATNIAEQVIYESTGAIVRHTAEGWVDAKTPPPNAPSTGSDNGPG